MAKKILVVDDETDLAKSIQSRLEHAGYATLVAYDGKGALEKARQEKPDLILLDIMMPGIDGFEVLRILRKSLETYYTPVIMVSGKGESQSLFEAQGLKVTDYIIKPFAPKTLLDLIKRYI